MAAGSGSASAGEYFSCAKKTGRIFFLGERSDENALSHFQVAGEFVGFLGRGGSSQGSGQSIGFVNARNLASGYGGGSLGYGDDPFGFEPVVYRLSPRGAVVVVRGIPGNHTVVLADQTVRPDVQLAHGNVELDSLALSASGDRAYWIQDGQPQSASLVGR